MSDMSDSNDEVDRLEEPVKVREVKQKRQLSEKQLENLSKARDKAKVVLAAKRERTQKLQKDERKLKQLKLKDRENKVAAEMRLLEREGLPPKPVTEPPDVPKPVTKTSKPKRKTKPKVVYYSSSSSSDHSSEDSSEEEVQYRRRPRSALPKRQRMAPLSSHQKMAPPQPSAQSENEDAMLEQQYQTNMRKMKRDLIMQSVFPTG
jgi:hypothetical protein